LTLGILLSIIAEDASWVFNHESLGDKRMESRAYGLIESIGDHPFFTAKKV